MAVNIYYEKLYIKKIKESMNMEENKFLSFLKSSTGRIVLTIVLYVVIFGIEYALLAAFNNNSAVFVVIAVVMAYFGWKALNRITPNMFLIMPISSWLWYWLIKGLLSIFVGALVAPYQIAKMITNKV